MEAVRTCVGCKGQGSRESLIRLVSVEGILTIDQAKRLPGRGAWLHINQNCLSLGFQRKAFNRALRVEFKADETSLAQQIEQAEAMLAKNE